MRKQAHLVLMAVFFILVNLLTLSRSPTVWQDEVSYTDPAVNLSQGKGFISTAWYQQNDREFWAGNVPLHQLALTGWLRVFPVSPAGVRSLNLLFLVLGIWLVFRIKNNLELWESPMLDSILMAMLFCTSGILFSYRSGRPDMLLFALGCLFGCGLLERNHKTGFAFLSASAFLLSWAGIQGIPWFAFLFVFINCLVLVRAAGVEENGHSRLLATMHQLFKNAICIAVSFSLGLAALLWLYRSQGVLSSFLASTFGAHTIASGRSLSLASGLSSYLTEDIVLLLVAACLLHGVCGRKFCATFYILAFAVTAIFPMVMGIVGKYPIYYHSMGLLMEILFCLHLLAQQKRQHLWRQWGTLGACMVIMVTGLPARTLLACKQWKQRDYSRVGSFLSEHISSSDVVYSTWAAYYGVKKIGSKCYFPTYIGDYGGQQATFFVMSNEERDGVNVLVLDLGKPVPALFASQLFSKVSTYDAGESKVFGRAMGAVPYRLEVWRKGVK